MTIYKSKLNKYRIIKGIMNNGHYNYTIQQHGIWLESFFRLIFWKDLYIPFETLDTFQKAEEEILRQIKTDNSNWGRKLNKIEIL